LPLILALVYFIEVQVELIKTINDNKVAIINNLEHESIFVYQFLKEQFNSSENIASDHLFHFVFRSFYRLDNAGLPPIFKKQFFLEMQSARNDSDIDINSICRRLYLFPNRKGQNTLQFSFVTKLANMLDEKLPIYDSEVAAIYNFKPSQSKNLDVKIDRLLNFYEELCQSYTNLVDHSDMQPVFELLHNSIEGSSNLSLAKQLDFIIWSAGKLKRRSELICV
jgi:hypothetical protein